MANAHITKHGFNSLGCDGRILPVRLINLGRLFLRVAKRLRPCKFSGPAHFCFSLILMWTSFLAGLGAEPPASDGGYKISGSIKYTAYGEKGALPPTESKFECHIDHCNWAIRIANHGMLTNVIQYYESAYIGDAVFTLEVHGNAGLEKLKAIKSPDELSRLVHFRDVGTVVPGMVPLSSLSVDIGPIWFAFCSPCYLDASAGRLKPIWTTPPKLFKNSNHVFAVNSRRARNKPYLPMDVEFISDGKMYDSKGEKYVQYEPFTNAVFEASDFTDVAGLFIPKKFRLTLLRPILTKTGTEGLKVACEWEGVVAEANVYSAGGVIDLPQIKANTQVKDYRPQMETKLGRIDYGITNGNWVSMGDLIFSKAEKQAKLIDRSKGIASKNREHSGGKRRVIVLITLGCLLAVVAYRVVTFFRAESVRQNQTKSK
ncbi:MAG: hypothetical protein WCH09_05650 [Bacteroidota bacterium]